MTPRLTIAIPTYGRPELLRRNVSSIVRQLTDDCRLMILDNCSPSPAAEVVADLTGPDAAAKGIRIVRHAANVGGDANILRCFELCETEWIWVLGDDDQIHEEGVRIALEEIDRHPNAVCINGPDMGSSRSAPFMSRGLAGFVDKMDDYGNMLFLSVNLYRRPAIIDNIWHGYTAIYAMGPHIGMLLNSLGDDGEVVFSTATLLEEHGYPEQPTWMPSTLARGVMALLDFPAVKPVAWKLGRKIATMDAVCFEVLMEEMIGYRRTHSWSETLRLYNGSVMRVIPYDDRPVIPVFALLYRALLVAPWLASGFQLTTGTFWMRRRHRREMWNRIIERAVFRLSPIAPQFVKEWYRRVRPELYKGR